MSEDAAVIPEVSIDVANIDVVEELKKPRLAAMLFAEYAVTSEDKKMTLCGIFDRIYIGREEDAKKRGKHRFFFFIKMAETVNEGIHVAILNPEGMLIAGGVVNLDEVPADRPSPKHVQLLQQVTIEFPTVGIYWFDVSFKSQLIGRVPLIVEYKPEETDGSDA